jgi:hypothetical protein
MSFFIFLLFYLISENVTLTGIDLVSGGGFFNKSQIERKGTNATICFQTRTMFFASLTSMLFVMGTTM